MSVFDWSDTIDDPENWTRGPVLPVGAAEVPAEEAERGQRSQEAAAAFVGSAIRQQKDGRSSCSSGQYLAWHHNQPP